GAVVNEHPNVSRRDFDLLKAILQRGPSMDEKEILRGKIAAVQMVNLRRGTKLMTLFEDVSWK
ncbi:RNA-directed DNA polymerase, partial [bacterium]|nr:RNA-directed DNA polymerase [bacterium]